MIFVKSSFSFYTKNVKKQKTNNKNIKINHFVSVKKKSQLKMRESDLFTILPRSKAKKTIGWNKMKNFLNL